MILTFSFFRRPTVAGLVFATGTDFWWLAAQTLAFFLIERVPPEPLLHLELFAEASTGKVFRGYPRGRVP
jgi:hypothetical protein